MSKHPKPAVLAFGRAGTKPPRAAWFATADIAVAQWAATHYSLTLLPATPELLKSLEVSLTEWQLGADGHPLLHVIAMQTFTRLQSFAAQAEAGDPAGIMASAQPAAAGPPAMTPEIEQARSLLWDAIGVNSVVLTLAEDPTLGWWGRLNSCVTSRQTGDMIGLKAIRKRRFAEGRRPNYRISTFSFQYPISEVA